MLEYVVRLTVASISLDSILSMQGQGQGQGSLKKLAKRARGSGNTQTSTASAVQRQGMAGHGCSSWNCRRLKLTLFGRP